MRTSKGMIYTGGGAIYNYNPIGKITPSTLRYVKVLSDLMLHFGALDNLRICEVGVGYGGQARVIHSLFTPKSYDFVDLNAALKLTQKYLSHYDDIHSTLNFLTLEDITLKEKEYDVFISNYAFSELHRDIQDVYTKYLITNAHNGYITYNNISPKELKSYALEEYQLQFHKDIHILEEIPNTHIDNRILIWKNQ
ncbi:putative sugar O-methyltransferase [Helicobacter sp. MIT 21-1697]|uniref:putative sugar O-methyltransferase n=1 Tax=Helicobacter sp. MIT 21-1697 TaxID=2993733 RepID=UPI00224ADFBA|nr:putative sugar O-methyltransferase [Helicobacter sp. MIT 21-1697]MCX2717381.1 putative sugar O-methyltransferase [Helicobacter sp. MIT 21-1697]